MTSTIVEDERVGTELKIAMWNSAKLPWLTKEDKDRIREMIDSFGLKARKKIHFSSWEEFMEPLMEKVKQYWKEDRKGDVEQIKLLFDAWSALWFAARRESMSVYREHDAKARKKRNDQNAAQASRKGTDQKSNPNNPYLVL